MPRLAWTVPGMRRRTRAVLLALAMCALPGLASAGGPDQFIGFGDSTMDSGFFRYRSTGGSPGLGGPGAAATLDGLIAKTVAAGGSGAFVGPGLVDTVQLAAKFGLNALPVTIPGGGTNYANGSAQTVATTAADGYLNGLYNNVPIVTQISNYLTAVHGAANPNALYMVSYGGNDLTWVETQGGSLPRLAYVQSLANSLSASIANLQAAGARTIVVLNVYAYARVVGLGGTLAPADAAHVDLAAAYSAAVWSDLSAAGVNFVPADVEGVLKYASQNPNRFGFTAATVLATSPACGTTSSILCAPAQLVTPNAQQTYLWSDDHHLTTAGQTLEADYIYSLLTAPGQIALLAETAVWSGLARTADIRGQIDQSWRQRGAHGINVWTGAGAGNLSVRNDAHFPNTSGTPFGGSLGVDYLTQTGIIVGGAVSAGGQVQNFSTGGHFTQVEEAFSLYAAWRTGPLWADAVASYVVLQNHVARQVPLGLFTDQNVGDTDGHALALAPRVGWDFHEGPVTFGPVAGFVLQQIRVNGFTESGTTGVTALSFGGQTRSSAVSQLGWRGAVDLGAWRPFVEMLWNHEWAGGSRAITASLTSIAAPSFTAPAVPVASDWASVSLGTSYQVGERISVRAAAAAMFIDPRVGFYGGGLWLNVGF